MAEAGPPPSPHDGSDFKALLQEVYGKLEALKQTHMDEMTRAQKVFLKEKKQLLDTAKAEKEKLRKNAGEKVMAEEKEGIDPSWKADKKLIRSLKSQVARLTAELDKRNKLTDENLTFLEMSASQGEQKHSCLFCKANAETVKKWREKSNNLQAEGRAEAERQQTLSSGDKAVAGAGSTQEKPKSPEKLTKEQEEAKEAPDVFEEALQEIPKDDEVVQDGPSSDEDEAGAGLLNLLSQSAADLEKQRKPNGRDKRAKRGADLKARKRGNRQEPGVQAKAEAEEVAKPRSRGSAKEEAPANGKRPRAGEPEEGRPSRRRRPTVDLTASPEGEAAEKGEELEEIRSNVKEVKTEREERRKSKGKKDGDDRYIPSGDAAFEDFDAFCPPKYGMGGEGFKGLLRIWRSGECAMICKCKDCTKKAGEDGLSMSPVEFENHAGRGATKKWRHSIWVVGSNDTKNTVEKSEWLKGGKGLVPVAAPKEVSKEEVVVA